MLAKSDLQMQSDRKTAMVSHKALIGFKNPYIKHNDRPFSEVW
jgi:hypothetical protein